MIRQTLLFLLLAIFLASTPLAQGTREIRGQISDQNQGSVSGATVILVDPTTQRSSRTISDARGEYRLDTLPGRYRLRVTREGFQPIEKSVEVAEQALILDLTLEPAQLGEVVNIVADAGGLTAAKLDVPLRDVPISLNTIPAELLESQAQNDLVSALRNVSSVNSYVGFGVYEYYRVRGFEQAVQLLDGVRNEGNRMNTQLNSIESVEVLKGPASVLYGGGAIGGAINLVRKRPQRDPAWDLTVAGGSFATKRIAGGVTGGLIGDKLLGRLDFGFEDADGWRANSARRFNVTPSLLWLISPRDQINFHLTINRDRFATDAGIPVVGNQVPTIPMDRRFNTPQDFALSHDYNTRIYYTRTISEEIQFRNTFSYRYFNDEYFSAETLSVNPAVNPTRVNRTFLYFDHHRRPVFNQMEGSVKFKTGVEHQAVGGWEYQRFFNFTNRSAAASTGTTPIDLFNPVETHTNRSFPISRIDSFANTFNAFYFQDQINLTKRLKAMIGGRLDLYRRWSRNDPVSNGDRRAGQRIEREKNAPTYRAGLVFQAKEWWAIYGSMATSFTPVNVVPFNQINLEPEEGRQFEIGQRLDLFQGRLNLTMAGYDIVRRNLAIFVRNIPIIDPVTGQSQGTGPQFDQAAAQRSRGFEFDLTGQPLAGLRRLQLVANYGYTNTSFTDYLSPSTNFDYTGRTVNFVPRHVGNFWTTYQWKSGLGGGLGGRYLSSVFTSNENDVRLGGYATWDLTAFYRRERWELTFNLFNALNKERYFVGGIYRTQLYPGRPLNYLVTLRIRSK
jgi:iron complex outermembrane receptor protein